MRYEVLRRTRVECGGRRTPHGTVLEESVIGPYFLYVVCPPVRPLLLANSCLLHFLGRF